jgi:microcystin-dependent protein
MSDQFIAEIRIFPFNFAPYGWAMCNGQILAISQYTALFSLLGTTYGGNGTSNFALPNFQGVAPMHSGNGAGLTPRVIGETGGEASVTLLASQIPAHTHSFSGGPGGRAGTVTTPTNNAVSTGAQGDGIYSTVTPPNVVMNPLALATTGGGQPHNNLMPYLVLNFCIALTGIFPPRN